MNYLVYRHELPKATASTELKQGMIRKIRFLSVSIVFLAQAGLLTHFRTLVPSVTTFSSSDSLVAARLCIVHGGVVRMDYRLSVWTRLVGRIIPRLSAHTGFLISDADEEASVGTFDRAVTTCLHATCPHATTYIHVHNMRILCSAFIFQWNVYGTANTLFSATIPKALPA